MKALKPKGRYKNESAWLDAVYRNNKATINEALEGVMGSKQSVFKSLVREYKDEGLTPTKALNRLSRSTIFKDYSTRAQENVLQGIRSQGLMKGFRRMSGWKTKIDPNKLQFEGGGTYIYDNKVRIDFKNSPYQIILEKI